MAMSVVFDASTKRWVWSTLAPTPANKAAITRALGRKTEIAHEAFVYDPGWAQARREVGFRKSKMLGPRSELGRAVGKVERGPKKRRRS